MGEADNYGQTAMKNCLAARMFADLFDFREKRSAVGTSCRFDGDLRTAVGAYLRGGSGFRLLRLFGRQRERAEFVDSFDNHKDAESYDNKVEDLGQKRSNANHGGSFPAPQYDIPLFETNAAGENRNQRHKNFLYESVHDGSECGADNHTYGKIDDVAAGDKLFKLIHEFFHLYFLLLFLFDAVRFCRTN